jgi:hypothetical protein
MAARYALIIASSVLGMTIFRVILNRVFAAASEHWVGSVVLAVVLGLMWFLFSFFCLFRVIRSEKENSPETLNDEVKKVSVFLSALTISALIASAVSLTAWLALYCNDAIFFSRLLPWIAPLITVQHSGFVMASRLFPCQAEGFDTGCEAYKWIPAFLIANALTYFPFVLGGVLWYRRSSAARTMLESVARRSVYWSAPVVVVGLCTLLVLHKLPLDTHDSLYPHPGIAHWHFGGWELLHDLIGTLIVIAGLLLPLYVYRAFRKSGGLSATQCRLSELTALMTVILAALTLGYVY